MELLRRIFDIVFPLIVAGLIVIVAVPADKYEEGGRMAEVRAKVAKKVFKGLNLSQQWGMYAPDPARAMNYMHLTAEEKGVRVVPPGKDPPPFNPEALPEGAWLLPEARWAEEGWGTRWLWQKTRGDIWRYRLSMKAPGKPNRGRSWYMRGVCVREARAGRRPAYIQMQQLKRRFTPPEKVRAGEPEFGPRIYRRSDRTWCRSKLVAEMIELDRQNNPEAYEQ